MRTMDELRKRACHVQKLTTGLTDPEIFILVKCYRITKGVSGRFPPERLAKPSIRKQLAGSGLSIEEVISMAKDNRVIDSQGDSIRCTSAGRAVEHFFVDLIDCLGFEPGYAAIDLRSLRSVGVLRVEMARLCDEDRRV